MGVLFTVLFVVVPIVELIIFTIVSDAIGLANTLLFVLVTAFIGASLVRWQGTSTWQRFREQQTMGQFPGATIMHGVLILVGGALLLTPGFLTDAVGFSLMVPPIRQFLIRRGRKLIEARTIIIR
jgi:UPF0716 protein FxsA